MHQREAAGAKASVSGWCSHTTAEAASWASVLHPKILFKASGITADTQKLESELRSFGKIDSAPTLPLWLALTSHKSCFQHELLESNVYKFFSELFHFTLHFSKYEMCLCLGLTPASTS